MEVRRRRSHPLCVGHGSSRRTRGELEKREAITSSRHRGDSGWALGRRVPKVVATPRVGFVFKRSLLREQRGDLGVVQLLLAVVRVDHQGGAARG